MTDDGQETDAGDGGGEQGNEPALRIRMGSKPGVSLRIKAAAWEFDGKKGYVIDAHVDAFREIAVATSGARINGEKTNRCVVIVPSETERCLEWHGFFVRGRFRVADKVWNPSLAAEMFREFQPS